MGIKKAKKNNFIIYAFIALTIILGAYYLFASGLFSSIANRAMIIIPAILIGLIVVGIASIPFLWLFNRIYSLWNMELVPEAYSENELKSFSLNREKWRQSIIFLGISLPLFMAVSIYVGINYHFLWGFLIFAFGCRVCFSVSDNYPIPKEKTSRQRNSGVHGDAGWAFFGEYDNSSIHPKSEDDFYHCIFLGRRTNPYIELVNPANKWESSINDDGCLSYTGETNGITFAPPGGGKNTSAIIPTLLVSNESTFVLDVKGENFFVTAPHRAKLGHRVIKINPFNLFGKKIGNYEHFTERFNPLANLRPDSADFVSNIGTLAGAIILEPNSGDNHFASRARDLVTCLIAHVCSNPKELEQNNNNLLRVYQILGYDSKEFWMYMNMASDNPLPIVRDSAKTFASPDSKEIDSVKSTAHTQLSFLRETGIRYFLSGHDFNFEDLRQEPTTIYCMLDLRQLEGNFRFARLMVQCLFNSLMTSPEYNDRRVLVLLDEQAQLKNMEVLSSSTAIMRGYKVRIWSIFQSLNQLKGIYGDSWETFISNAGFIQFFRPNDDMTAEYISKKVGDETITETQLTYSNTNSRDHEGRNTGSTGTSTGEKTFNKRFLSVQDLYGMPEDRAVIFYSGLKYPILSAPQKYFMQNPIERIYYGNDYAPHPVHDQDAFDWMKNYYNSKK
jgi:type IV secretory pathway TraG/TraD family ATPase VirD4